MHPRQRSEASPRQRRLRSRKRSPAGLLAVALISAAQLAGGPAAAQSHWTVRGHGSWWAGIDDRTAVTRTSAEGTEERAIHSVSDGSSFGLSLEFVVKSKLGIELGFLVGSVDTDLTLDVAGGRLADSDRFDLYATTLGLNYHFTPRRRTHLYLGAFVQQSNYSDVTFLTEAGRNLKLSFDDDYGIGLKLGVDVPFQQGAAKAGTRNAGSWLFTADARYVATILESELPGEDLDLHPLILSAGIGYRF